LVPDSIGGLLARMWPKRRYGPSRPLIAEVRDRFGQRFTESNKALSSRLGRDLGSLGYTIA